MTIRLGYRVVGWVDNHLVRGHVQRLMLGHVLVQPDGGGDLVRINDGDYRLERFTEYLFARKQGFGRTPWPRFILLQLASLFFLVVSIIQFQEAWPITALVLLGEGAWALGTIRNFKGLSA